MLLPGRTFGLISLAVLTLGLAEQLLGQGMNQGSPPSGYGEISKVQRAARSQLEDITDRAGIRFEHDFSPEAHSILESMAGGVLLLDYDPRRMAGYLLYECRNRRASVAGQKSPRCALPQQP